MLTKIYSDKTNTFQIIKEEIIDAVKDLNVTLNSIILDESDFITVTLSGEDEIAAANYLKSLYGESKNLEEISVGDTLTGYICSSGKVGFGLFVDIGIKEPYVLDALIPLFTLRKQLMNDKIVPARKIIGLFGLIDNLPVEITIEEKSIGLKKVEARFSDEQIARFDKWIDEGLDKLIVLGAFDDTINEVLETSEHEKDIIEIETIGWRENVLTCKFNTSAKGLIPIIGRLLPKVRLEIFSPSRIKKERKEYEN
ncbi:MAG: DUF2110 family protein [Candidatus Thorarchaeota archaeon]